MVAQRKQQFTSRPDYLVPTFLKHLKTTGEPHTWPYHTAEPPPLEGIEILYRDFQIPEHHVRVKGYAPCPICNPNSPKYGHGHLLWSRVSGNIYAVGHCCGFKYFEEGVFASALARERISQDRKARELFVERNWARVSEYGQIARALKPAAREYDRVLRLLLVGLTQYRAREIYRITSQDDGHLAIYRKNGDGEALLSTKSPSGVLERFGTKPLQGFDILRLSRSNKAAESYVVRPAETLTVFEWAEKDEAVEWLCEASDDELKSLADIMVDAERDLRAVLLAIHHLKLFIERDNLKLLTAWSRRRDADKAQVWFYRKSPETVSMWRGGRPLRTITLSDDLHKLPVSITSLIK